MTDYGAEQEMEVEALSAILMDDLQEEPTPSEWSAVASCYRVAIRSEEEVADGALHKKLDLIFAHTPKYPDEPPQAKFSSVQGMSSSDISAAEELLKEQIQANLGMAMMYTIIIALKEWLADQVAGLIESLEDADIENVGKLHMEAEEQRMAAIRAEGTPVTRESFLMWRQKFNSEREQQQLIMQPDKTGKDKGPTGKAFFQDQDANKDGRAFDENTEEEEEEEEEEEGVDLVDSAANSADDDDDDDDEDVIEELLAMKQRH